MKKAIAIEIPKLTDKERMRLEICTDIILKALDSQREGGIRLIEVRDSKLYREDFKTFEKYCEVVLHMSKTHAYRLIQDAEVIESLPEKIAEKITTESQTRVLAAVPEENRVEVIKTAEKSGPITAASLKAAIADLSPIGDKDQPIESGKSTETPSKNGKSKPKPVFDEIGTQIPSDALPFWNRRQEAQDLLTTVSKIKGLIQKSQEKEDPFFAKVSNGVIDELNRVYNHLLEAKPYAVCTTCMGSFSVQPKGCSFCGNKGLISKWQWDTQSRAEIKTIRIKAVAAARA